MTFPLASSFAAPLKFPSRAKRVSIVADCTENGILLLNHFIAHWLLLFSLKVFYSDKEHLFSRLHALQSCK